MILVVPSVIISRERNYLINPRHPDFPRLTIDPPTDFAFESAFSRDLDTSVVPRRRRGQDKFRRVAFGPGQEFGGAPFKGVGRSGEDRGLWPCLPEGKANGDILSTLLLSYLSRSISRKPSGSVIENSLAARRGFLNPAYRHTPGPVCPPQAQTKMNVCALKSQSRSPGFSTFSRHGDGKSRLLAEDPTSKPPVISPISHYFTYFTLSIFLLLFHLTPSSAQSFETLQDPRGPTVIHVIKIPRDPKIFRLQSVHATGRSLGLETVARQATRASGTPVAALNADFYERAGSWSGDPRGLQIIDGELVSAPNGGPSFWVDAIGDPHLGETTARLEISWNGQTHPIGLNSFRETNGLVLYTHAMADSTRTADGREFLLAGPGTNPLRPNRTYRTVVSNVFASANSPLAKGTLVLSIGPNATAFASLKLGDEITLSTHTEPSLRGVRDAISGGPILVRNGKRQRIKAPSEDSYEFSTMMERHPRSALGWNNQFYFFVAVDGRHKGVSMGLTLDDFAAKLVQIGCQEALNLDGGGSSTLWFEGKVRNYLCDGYERDVANAIVVTRKGGQP